MKTLATLFHNMRKRQASKVPAGFRTVEQWGKAEGLSTRRAYTIISELMQAGLLEHRRLKCVNASGAFVMANHYRSKKQ